jgi:hypothetical protein
MEMHQSPLDMFEYKTKQEDATNTEQTNEVNDWYFFSLEFNLFLFFLASIKYRTIC